MRSRSARVRVASYVHAIADLLKSKTTQRFIATYNNKQQALKYHENGRRERNKSIHRVKKFYCVEQVYIQTRRDGKKPSIPTLVNLK
jgi:hypothetical protein